MKIAQIIREGGWDTTLTQNTVLHPKIVSVALQVVDKFVADFNVWLSSKGQPQVRRGRPTGSSAYHEIDSQEEPEKVYGDIDLQMIGEELPGKSYGQFTNFWNSAADQFVKEMKPAYVDMSESKPGHPIFQVGKSDYVQIDFMWHPERLEKWGATRVTPERGMKGLLMGNMFSVLGELLDMSIQHAGVQLKVIDGSHVPFSKQKGTETITVTTEPETFLIDILMYEAEQQGIPHPIINPRLRRFKGASLDNIKIQDLVEGVKGLAHSFGANMMYGEGDLANFEDGDDFLNKFIARYEQKAMLDVNAAKRDKAQTPQAIARAEQDKQKVLSGLATVKGYFNG
jgi:hypothetical protein